MFSRRDRIHSLLGAALLLPALAAGGCTGARCASVATLGNLGPDVNTPEDDYAPVLQDTSTLIFTSNRSGDDGGGLRGELSGLRPAHLFLSMRLSDRWDEGQPYDLAVEAIAGEAATITFAPAHDPFNTVAYISACGREPSVGGCDIYAVTTLEHSAIIDLGPVVNSSGWDGHPYVTPSGSRLYFASDRPGGLGGDDIWYCERQTSGTWGDPVNAGPRVNTSGDENSPFFDTTTGRLYFAASTGSFGLDIFVLDPDAEARRLLPAPYNSEGDDFTPFMNGGMLYLASNRAGGCGGYDLYGFPIE